MRARYALIVIAAYAQLLGTGCDNSNGTSPDNNDGVNIVFRQDLHFSISVLDNPGSESLIYQLIIAQPLDGPDEVEHGLDLPDREVVQATINDQSMVFLGFPPAVYYAKSFVGDLPLGDEVQCVVELPEGTTYSTKLDTGIRLGLDGIVDYMTTTQDSIEIQITDWAEYTHAAIRRSDEVQPYMTLEGEPSATIPFPEGEDFMTISIIAFVMYPNPEDETEYGGTSYSILNGASSEVGDTLIVEHQDHFHTRTFSVVKVDE